MTPYQDRTSKRLTAMKGYRHKLLINQKEASIKRTKVHKQI